MDLNELKRNYYLFDPKEYGRIFVFVDFSNVRHWAKSFWPEENKEYLKREIDIRKLAAISDLVNPIKKFFYYGHYKEYPELSPDHAFNIKFRQSIYRIDKARKAGFIPRTKDIKEIDNFDDEGKFLGRINKCNFDIEITMDALLKIEKYDSVFLWSGDSDFHLLLQYLKSKKKKIIVICARDFASDELQNKNTSDLFIPADPLKNLLEYIPENKSTPGLRREA
jgi:uncharacterized LabA/DUF88 family protein